LNDSFISEDTLGAAIFGERVNAGELENNDVTEVETGVTTLK
jgi:hypothetical protein